MFGWRRVHTIRRWWSLLCKSWLLTDISLFIATTLVVSSEKTTGLLSLVSEVAPWRPGRQQQPSDCVARWGMAWKGASRAKSGRGVIKWKLSLSAQQIADRHLDATRCRSLVESFILWDHFVSSLVKAPTWQLHLRSTRQPPRKKN